MTISNSGFQFPLVKTMGGRAASILSSDGDTKYGIVWDDEFGGGTPVVWVNRRAKNWSRDIDLPNKKKEWVKYFYLWRDGTIVACEDRPTFLEYGVTSKKRVEFIRTGMELDIYGEVSLTTVDDLSVVSKESGWNDVLIQVAENFIYED